MAHCSNYAVVFWTGGYIGLNWYRYCVHKTMLLRTIKYEGKKWFRNVVFAICGGSLSYRDLYERKSIFNGRSLATMEFGYARVSTSHQNTDRQIEALLEYGIPERNIIVDKQSGKDFERVGYLALKNTMLRAGDTLVIKELDRLGRNKQMIKEELEWLKAHEIRVKILNVPTSLMECDGQDWILEMVSNILIEVMASIAEEERLKNHQRQSEGIQAAKNRGVVFGRPTVRKPENYEAVMEKVASGDMKAVEAMREMGIKKTTFYKLKKLYPMEVTV